MTAALAAPSVSLVKERAALYRFFRKDGALLYVGITNSLGVRWQAHMGTSEWWNLADRMTAEWKPTRALARRAELAAIRGEHPLYNIAGKPKALHGTVPTPQIPAVSLVKRIDFGWIDMAEVAVRLGVSEPTVYRSLKNPMVADREWGAGNWRRKPLLQRARYQVRRSVAEAKARGESTT